MESWQDCAYSTCIALTKYFLDENQIMLRFPYTATVPKKKKKRPGKMCEM